MTLKLNREALTALPPDGEKGRDDETAPMTFPKEFEKSLADFIDKRFAWIWALTIAFEVGSIVYLLSTAPAKMSETGSVNIQKGFVERLRDQELEREAKLVETPSLNDQPPELIAPAKSSAGRRVAATGNSTGNPASRDGAPAGVGGAISSGSSDYRAPVSASRRTREDISHAASRAGILGLLTSSALRSDEAAGRAAEDVLGGDNVPMANLDDAFANAGGLRRGSAKELGQSMGPGGDVAGNGTGNSREVRGGRATNAGGIDALVQGLGEGKSQGVQRSGGLEVGGHEPLIEEPSEDGKATGSRNRDAVAAVVAGHTSAIQYCYQRELKRNPNLKGKIVVRFVITPQGTVSSVTIIASTLGNPTVESCIVERIKRWDDFGAIDPAKGNTTFRQVYTFGY
jgi:TonB family protein